MLYITITFLVLFIVFYNIFMIFFRYKLNKLGEKTINLFSKRNNKIISIYNISEKYLTKHKEVFEEFFKLKRKDFSENLYDLNLDEKIITYRNIHNEINFIFKVCEKHNKINKNAIYNYTKEQILDKSLELWKQYKFYKYAKDKFDKMLIISKITLIWFFI